jgi:hypothetical protein
MVGRVGSGQARTHVQELPDAALTCEVADGAGQERAVRPRASHHLRAAGGDLGGCLAIGRQAVLAAEPYAVDSRRMGYRWVKTGIYGRVLGTICESHAPER